MLIHTPARQLHILKILQKTDSMVTYVCTDIAEPVQEQYLLNGFLEQQSYHALIPMMIAQNREYFTDFIEYFSADGIFYLMFQYYEGKPCLKEADRAEMLVRLEIVRQMIEQMILQSMPLTFQYAVLNPEQVLLTEQNQVRFLYQFSENFTEAEVQFHDVELRLLEMIRKLLIPELAMQYSVNLLDFCQKLEHGNEYLDYRSIYIVYTEIQKELTEQKNNLISHKYQFQLWEKTKRSFTVIKRVFLVAVVALAVGLFLYQIFWKKENKSENTRFTQIGTLVIKENQPADNQPETAEEMR